MNALQPERENASLKRPGSLSTWLLLPTLGLWAAGLMLMIKLADHLLPLAAAGRRPALLMLIPVVPQVLYLLQALFYLPRRRGEEPIFLEWLLAASPLLFLPLKFLSPVAAGPAFEAVTGGEEERELIVRRALERSHLSLSGRLALLLEARSPLDRLLAAMRGSKIPLLPPLARLLGLVVAPVRLLTRSWGYLALSLWRRLDDPGPLDEATALRRAQAGDLVFQAGRLAEGPADWAEFNRALGRLRGREGPAGAAAPPEFRAPWLQPGYRGLYQFPATWGCARPEDLYDGGPEEDASLFYPPELGAEVDSLALLEAERSRLLCLAAGLERENSLVAADGRLRPLWEVEADIGELDFKIAGRRKRLAAHHRRRRSSCLAAARRRGGEWPAVLRRLGLELFVAERFRPDLKDEVLAGLLAAEEEVSGKGEGDGGREFLKEGRLAEEIEAFSSAGPEAAFDLIQPPPEERPPRLYYSAESFGLGFAYLLLAVFLLALLAWQGFSLE